MDWSKLGTDSLHKYKNAKMANLPPTISSKEDLISHVSKHFSQQVVPYMASCCFHPGHVDA